jgi:hypothetical protein
MTFTSAAAIHYKPTAATFKSGLKMLAASSHVVTAASEVSHHRQINFRSKR